MAVVNLPEDVVGSQHKIVILEQEVPSSMPHRTDTAGREAPPRDGKVVLHNRLAVLRADRGLSRRDLAEAVGVNPQTIGYLERGDYNPSLELAFRLSQCFGLPIEMIFSTEPFRPLSAAFAGRGENLEMP